MNLCVTWGKVQMRKQRKAKQCSQHIHMYSNSVVNMPPSITFYASAPQDTYTHTYTHPVAAQQVARFWRIARSACMGVLAPSSATCRLATSQLLFHTYLFTQFALLLLNHFSSTYFCCSVTPRNFFATTFLRFALFVLFVCH